MRRAAAVLSALTLTFGAATAVASTANAGNDNDAYTVSGGHGHAGYVPARDSNAARPSGGGGKSLIWHKGDVRHAVTDVEAIFVGSDWTKNSFAGDKISGLDTLYGGLSSTNNYAKTNSEYYDSTGPVNPGVHYLGHTIDSTTTFTGDPGTAALAAEVTKMVKTPTAGGYYPVYITGARGSAGYCAWHDTTTAGGVEIQVGFFFNLDGDPGCDPVAPSSEGSQGLAALANVTGHEYSEMVTDPMLTAWWDSSGAENADKCAWTFGSSLLPIGSKSWKIQGNWSNAAYSANTGYKNGRKTVVGCIDGTNA